MISWPTCVTRIVCSKSWYSASLEPIRSINSLAAGIEQCRKFRFPVTIVMPIGIGQFLAECFCR